MGLKILIVEDDRLLAEAVSDYFTGKGWKTDVVYDGNSAVETVERKSYQMILLDVMLPGRDGFSVCRKIREMTETPVFFIPRECWRKMNLTAMLWGRMIISLSLFPAGALCESHGNDRQAQRRCGKRDAGARGRDS